MARYDGYELDENGNLIIDVTKTARPEMAGPRIDVTREPPPIIDALTIDAAHNTRPDPVFIGQNFNPLPSETGQFRKYTQVSSRAPGDFTERTVSSAAGAPRIQAADRSLMRRGAGGLRIVDPIMPEDGFGMRREAAGVSGDGRIVLSPEAIGELGKRQIMEEQAAQALQGPLPKQNLIDVTRRDMQRVADMGFVPRGTDAMRQQQMRGTLQRGQQDWLERNRPKDMMQRLNTSDQIMAQAEGAQMTPQVVVADGVMAGYEPISKRIVSDSSGARAIAASKIPDKSLDAEDDKTLIDTYSKMQQRKAGKLGETEARWYSMLLKEDPKEAEQYKRTIIGEWTDNDDQLFGQITSRLSGRGLLNKQPAQKTGAPYAQGKKTLGGIQAR
jgi:hypothetical protein